MGIYFEICIQTFLHQIQHYKRMKTIKIKNELEKQGIKYEY